MEMKAIVLDYKNIKTATQHSTTTHDIFWIWATQNDLNIMNGMVLKVSVAGSTNFRKNYTFSKMIACLFSTTLKWSRCMSFTFAFSKLKSSVMSLRIFVISSCCETRNNDFFANGYDLRQQVTAIEINLGCLLQL